VNYLLLSILNKFLFLMIIIFRIDLLGTFKVLQLKVGIFLRFLVPF